MVRYPVRPSAPAEFSAWADHDKPVQVPMFVYAYAKLQMLEFVYDFVFRFVPRDRVRVLYMDTDSLYCAYAGASLDDCVPPENKRAFYAAYRDFFPAPTCDGHWPAYVAARLVPPVGAPPPGDCAECAATRAYQKRTPGLFKVEFEGDEFMGLNSKTYYCRTGASGRAGDKHSCKGVQKRRNPLLIDDYRRVLETGETRRVSNAGFRAVAGRVHTYLVEKAGLTAFYVKRYVEDDGVHTSTLNRV